MMLNLFECSCCHYPVFSALRIPYSSGMCPVCFWKQDAHQIDNPTETGGANLLSLNESRKRWPKLAREIRKEEKELDKSEGKLQEEVLGLEASDEDLRAKDLEECIIDKGELQGICKHLRPVVEVLNAKITPQRSARIAKALDSPDPHAVLRDVLWSLVEYEISLPEPLHASLVRERHGQNAKALLDEHVEKLQAELRQVARALRGALPAEAEVGFEKLLQQKKYPSAAKLLLQYVTEESEHYGIMDGVAMRLGLQGTRWEGLEDRLYQLLSDLRGTVPDSELWVYPHFILNREYSEGVEFWLWRIYALSITLPRKSYDALSRLAAEMRLEDFYLEGIEYTEKE